jgi:hypothetical protein
VNKIAKFNGTTWKPIGGGAGGGFNHYVYALTADSAGHLIAAGWLAQTADGVTSLNGIAKLDNTDNSGAWTSIGAGAGDGGGFRSNGYVNVYALFPTPMLTLSLPAEAAKR